MKIAILKMKMIVIFISWFICLYKGIIFKSLIIIGLCLYKGIIFEGLIIIGLYLYEVISFESFIIIG